MVNSAGAVQLANAAAEEICGGNPETLRQVGSMLGVRGSSLPSLNMRVERQGMELSDGRWIELSWPSHQLGRARGVRRCRRRHHGAARCHRGTREHARAGSVHGRALARAADAGDLDLRLLEAAPAARDPRPVDGDHRRHRGGNRTASTGSSRTCWHSAASRRASPSRANRSCCSTWSSRWSAPSSRGGRS